MTEQTKVTFCRICEASCGLLATVSGGKVQKLEPDPDHVVSRGYACVKGIRYTELHASEDRVQTPLKRVGDRFEPVSWEQALHEIGEKVRDLRERHGEDSVGMYVGNPAALSPPHMVFAGLFQVGLRSRHLYTSGSQDCNNKFVAAEEMFGSPLLQAIPDIDHAQCVIMIGTNPAISQLSLANVPRVIERLKAVTRTPGGRVVFINPRLTESARQVGDHLSIRPGSDVFFLLAFAHVVFEAELVVPAMTRFVEGLDDLREVVRPWTPEKVAKLTGIDAATLRGLVHEFCRADGAVLYAGTGVNQGPHGTLSAWLLSAIQVLTGNLDRRGGMLVTRQQQRTARLSHPSGERIVHHTSRFSAHPSVLDSLPAGIMADEILTPGKGQLRALFVTAGNPVLSCPNSARMREALAQLPLLVCIDLFRNETGNLAHYILPTTSFLERPDMPMGVSGYQPVPYLQLVDAVVEPLGQTRDEWWIFAQLARVCGVPINRSRLFQSWLNLSVEPGSVLPRLLRFAPVLLFALMAWLERVSLRKLRKHPHGVLLRPHKGGVFLGRGVLTKSGKVRLAPPRFLEAARGLEADFEAQLRARKKLLLITKRERKTHNTWMHNARSLGSDRDGGTNHLYVHPLDASARNLGDGDLCQVRAGDRVLRVPVRISDDLMAGAVALPHGWGHAEADGLRVAQKAPGVNANLLAQDGAQALEPLSGMSRLTAFEVDLEKV